MKLSSWAELLTTPVGFSVSMTGLEVGSCVGVILAAENEIVGALEKLNGGANVGGTVSLLALNDGATVRFTVSKISGSSVGATVISSIGGALAGTDVGLPGTKISFEGRAVSCGRGNETVGDSVRGGAVSGATEGDLVPSTTAGGNVGAKVSPGARAQTELSH